MRLSTGHGPASASCLVIVQLSRREQTAPLRAVRVRRQGGEHFILAGNLMNTGGMTDRIFEIIELMLVWLIFTGTAEVWRVNQHFAVDILPSALAGSRYHEAYRAFVAVAGLLFVAVFTWKSLELLLRADDLSPYFSLPRRLWYAAMPVNGALMVLFSLRQLWTMLASARGGPRPGSVPGDRR